MVGARDQLGGGVRGGESREADLDPARLSVGCERGLYGGEAVADTVVGGTRHHAEELVAAEANDRVIGA